MRSGIDDSLKIKKFLGKKILGDGTRSSRSDKNEDRKNDSKTPTLEGIFRRD